MYTNKQLKELKEIQTMNVIKGNNLSCICMEEIGEFITAFNKYCMGEVTKDEILSEGVDVMNTMYNLLNFAFDSVSVNTMIDEKIKKAKKVLEMGVQ